MTQNTSHAVMQQRHEAHDSLDDFPTPCWGTRALMEHVIGTSDWKSCWEPAANRGYMVRPLREYFKTVHGSDVHDYGAGFEVADFLMHGTGAPGEFDWIISNPPFRLAAQFIEKAIKMKPRSGFAFLVRTSFLEGQDRYNTIFSKTPPWLVAQFTERLPMVKGRYDPEASTATSYAWLVWRSSMLSNEHQTLFQWIPPCRRQLQKASDAHPQEIEGLKTP